MDIQEILASAKTIAVVGCSGKADRTSYKIAQYLQEVGFIMIPVNPTETEILGETCYATLDAIPKDIVIDIVNIFRRPQFTEEVVAETLKRISETGENPVIWTQLGVSSEAAKRLAENNGLSYVLNRCILVENERMRE
jgi:uncharacterized protein